MGMFGGGGLPGLGGGANTGMATGLNGINGSPGGGGGMFSNTNGGVQLSQIPFIGGLFPNPNEGAMRDAMAAAGQAYANMRPQQAQGWQNIMSNVQNQMAPAHQALANMYGGQHGQNSDVTAAIDAQNQSSPAAIGSAIGSAIGGGPRASDNSGKGFSPKDFLNILDPGGGLTGTVGGMMGLSSGGGPGGIMNAPASLLGGGSGGPLGGILGGGGGGIGGILGGLPGLDGGGGGGILGGFGL